MSHLLELRHVSAGYRRESVLEGVNLNLVAGEIVTLIGANGAGKSTLVKVISGLLPAFRGDILLKGQRINDLSPSGRLRIGISHVPEGRLIFSGMTVMENLTLGAHVVHDTRQELRERITEIARTFPILAQRISSIAGNFSGGQQQMLAIARGLMSRPRLLLLDEPSLGIAPILVAEIFDLIRALRDQGITILLAEQNARQALSIADRGYVLENGKVAMSGIAAELLASENIAARYLGIGAQLEVDPDQANILAERLNNCLFGSTEVVR